jgi:hypothetical protein
MSNVNAVAVATEGLKALLQRALDEAGPASVTGARVSAVRPSAIPTNFLGVNVFLYQITPNGALRNDDLPTRRGNGELIRRPQIAIDLHYLLTFVGDEVALEPQRMLGGAAAGLHAHPELTPEDLEEIADNAPADSYLRLHNDLAQQVERVRFTFEVLDLEELSKLWSMFPQKPYELSVAVRGSVLLIEAPLTPMPRPPVLRRGIYTGMPRPPALSSITPQLTPRTVPGTGARARLVLDGVALSGDGTRVRIADLSPVTPVAADDARVVVAIPDELRAGIHAARVLVAHVLRNSETSRPFELESNALPFVLEPRITTPSPLSAIAGGMLAVQVEPAIAPRQQVRVIIGSHAIRWHTPLPGPGVPDEHDELTVELPAEIEAGAWPLRIEVDGATSALTAPPAGSPPGTVMSPHVEVT